MIDNKDVLQAMEGCDGNREAHRIGEANTAARLRDDREPFPIGAAPVRPMPWPVRAERFLRRTGPCVLLLALVPYGSTGSYAFPVASIGLALWCGAAFLLCGSLHPLIGIALALALVLGGWIALQIQPGLGLLPPQPIWKEAADLLGRGIEATVSVAPSRTLSALPAVLVPLLVFAAVFILYRTDRQAIRLMRFLATGGTAIALFGIVQYVLFPDRLLLETREVYRDSLTAVFVNRNTAATFFGCTALLLIGFVSRRLDGRPALRALVVMAIEPGKARREWRLALDVSYLLVVAMALFLTKSRAGLAATLVAAICLLPLLTARTTRSRKRRFAARLWRRLGAVALGLIALAGATLLFGQQTLRRATMRGFEDERFCVLPGIWRLARDAWPLGTGAGTFDLVFPAYRDPACGIYWTWDRAHNFFLEGLITMGAAFAVVCAIGTVALLVVLVRGIGRRRRERFAPAVGLAAVVLLVLHNLVDFSLQIPGMAAWASALLGVTASVALKRSDGRGENARFSKILA